MEQISINKVIGSISHFGAWKLAHTLSSENGDNIIPGDCYEDDYQTNLNYLTSHINANQLTHPLFEVHFLTQMGHILVYDRIDSIMPSVTDELLATSNYLLDIYDDKSATTEYLNNACYEICKMLNLKDEWANLDKILLKYPNVSH